MAKRGRGGLTDAQNEHMRAAMNRALAQPGMNQTELAKALHTEQGTISAFVNRRNGSSYPMAEALAKHMRISVSEVIGAGEPSTRRDPPPMHHNLASLLDARAKAGQPYSARAIEQTAGDRNLDGADLSQHDWAEILDGYERAARRAGEVLELAELRKRAADQGALEELQPPKRKPKKK